MLAWCRFGSPSKPVDGAELERKLDNIGMALARMGDQAAAQPRAAPGVPANSISGGCAI
jgi:hypothetical protein